MSSSKIYFDLLSKPDTRNFICGNICLSNGDNKKLKLVLNLYFWGNFPLHKKAKTRGNIKSIFYFKPVEWHINLWVCRVIITPQIQKWQPLVVTFNDFWKEGESNNKSEGADKRQFHIDLLKVILLVPYKMHHKVTSWTIDLGGHFLFDKFQTLNFF